MDTTTVKDSLEMAAIITQLQNLLRFDDMTAARMSTEVASGAIELHELQALRALARSPQIDPVTLCELIEDIGAIKTFTLYSAAGLGPDLTITTALHEARISPDVLDALRYKLLIY